MKIKVDVTDVDINVKPGWSKVSIDSIRQLKKLVRECTEAYLTRVRVSKSLWAKLVNRISGCMQKSDKKPQTLPLPEYKASKDRWTPSAARSLYGRLQVQYSNFR